MEDDEELLTYKIGDVSAGWGRGTLRSVRDTYRTEAACVSFLGAHNMMKPDAS